MRVVRCRTARSSTRCFGSAHNRVTNREVGRGIVTNFVTPLRWLIEWFNEFAESPLPGPAASRLQGARRSFPKDDLFFRESVFAKCWKQGVHRRYAAVATGDQWAPMRERLHAAFGVPENVPLLNL